jgi:hypothetical protein
MNWAYGMFTHHCSKQDGLMSCGHRHRVRVMEKKFLQTQIGHLLSEHRVNP